MRKQTLHNILDTLGFLLVLLGLLLLLPIFIAAIYGEYEAIKTFALSGFVTAVCGGLLRRIFKFGGRVSATESFLICGLAWLVLSIFACLPFIYSAGRSFLDAYFETVSGFTTTGITIFNNIEVLPKSVIFWRAFIQWLGGLGILTLFVAIMSTNNAYSELFAAESHKISSARPTPNIWKTALYLWGIYTLLTLLESIILMFLGVTPFDAVVHSFTSLSTGGFSSYNASIDYFRRAGYEHYKFIEYTMSFFMFLGGMNFLMHYKVLRGRFSDVAKNAEFRVYLLITLIAVSLVFVNSVHKGEEYPPLPNESASESRISFYEGKLRASVFTVISILTTTGYGTVDINEPFFPSASKQIILILMLIGGCVGSTGGGIKVIRVFVLFKQFLLQVTRLRLPRGALCEVVIDGEILSRGETRRIVGLFFGWLFLLFLGGIITAFFTNLDPFASFSGMFSALGNIGPCYFSVKIMTELPSIVKITYIFGMLAGRLEILPVLLIFSPKAWRG